MHKHTGFTLIEICLAVLIALILITVAVPSIQGLLSEQRAKQTFDNFDALVRSAQSLAVAEQRAYLIAWGDEEILLRPEQPANKDEAKGVKHLEFGSKEKYEIYFPAALFNKPPGEWIFWPTGTCESARVVYKGPAGSWVAQYNPLTVRAMVLSDEAN